MEKENFFIGWSKQMPDAYRNRMWWTLGLLSVGVAFVATVLVFAQRGFSESKFDIAKLTTLEGKLEAGPLPCLILYSGKDAQGTVHLKRVLLIGFGKHGAEATLTAMEIKQGKVLDGKFVKLEGKLIYFDGVLAMELTRGADAFKGFAAEKEIATQKTALGNTTLQGEILDPKCFLGVMRPGEGKPHRSCAIRCLEGGIPSFFRSVTPRGEVYRYFFVLDQDGHLANYLVKGVIADQVEISGQAEKWDNWLIIKMDNRVGAKVISSHLATSGDISLCTSK